MAKKSLYEAKVEDRRQKNKNVITDMDYYFRDKNSKEDVGNSIWMSSKPQPKPKPSPKPSKGKEVV